MAQIVELPAPDPQVSVVVTLLNEVATLDELYRRTRAAIEAAGYSFEMIFVDDGSTAP